MKITISVALIILQFTCYADYLIYTTDNKIIKKDKIEVVISESVGGTAPNGQRMPGSYSGKIHYLDKEGKKVKLDFFYVKKLILPNKMTYYFYHNGLRQKNTKAYKKARETEKANNPLRADGLKLKRPYLKVFCYQPYTLYYRPPQWKYSGLKIDTISGTPVNYSHAGSIEGDFYVFKNGEFEPDAMYQTGGSGTLRIIKKLFANCTAVKKLNKQYETNTEKGWLEFSPKDSCFCQ